jgi:GNAT superfamily N-acetyltransferase
VITTVIEIRPAVTEDIDAILKFEQGVVAAERPLNDQLKTGEVHYYDVAALVASSTSQVLVAEDAGRLIGTGHASIKASLEYLAHDQHAYLGLMYVDPEFRGRGIIQSIIADLMQWARTMGVSDFYLDVYAQNQSAVKAYEKFGFKPNLIEMKMHDR